MLRYTWFFMAVLSGTTAVAADWPQWQGPDRNAVSKETGLLREWPKDGPPLAWKVKDLGGGYSAPSVAAGRIFGMSNRDNDEVVWALDEKNGNELWVKRLGAAYTGQRMPQGREGPSCTPTVDGERLYVIGRGGDLACLQVKDGKILWQRSLTKDFGGRVPTWSYNESPLVDGDKVVCTPGGPDASLAALDKLTGKTIWKSRLPSDSADRNPNGPNRPDQGNGSGGRGGGSTTAVTGTKDPGLFQSEHFGMRAFSCKTPNGKYLAKLYFAETYEGIRGAGQRVFSFSVQGHDFKDFDIWAKASGARRAYVESVPVEVTNGVFRIVFTAKIENPAIKAIELIPRSKDAKNTPTIRIKAGQSTPFKDSSGHVWQPDQGFEGGQMSPGTFQFSAGPRGGRGGGGFGGFGGSGAAYASAIAIDVGGQREYVQFTATGLVGVAASDGKFLWRYDRPANRSAINCSSPIFHDGLVFASSAYGAGGGLVKLIPDGNGGVKPQEVYSTRKMQNHHGGMILHDGSLYGAHGGNEGGLLTCLDFKTGKVLWSSRQAPKGSVALADGRLYYRTENGIMLLIEPSPKGYVERGRFRQPDRSELPAWSHPVLANGKLYLRDQEVLLCYDVKKK